MKSTSRPVYKLGAAVITTVVIACLYVLSYGPAYWLVWTFKNPRFEKTIAMIYWPLDVVVRYGPVEMTDALVRYCDFWYPG